MRWLILFLLIGHLHAMDQQVKETAIFAGGCFWCMQPPFDALKGKGVIETTVGYTGGNVANPSYEMVSSGTTGHAEAIQIVFDPEQVSYQELLEIFWRNVDPTAKDRQFCDTGRQYRSAIFYVDETQKKLATASKEQLKERFETVYTEILPAGDFYPAEDYHQDYYLTHPYKYSFYKRLCGRDKRLKEIWE